MTKLPSDANVNSLHSEPTPYVFRGATTALAERKGQLCRIVKRWHSNTLLIEFEDGQRSVVPAYVVRRQRGATWQSKEAD